MSFEKKSGLSRLAFICLLAANIACYAQDKTKLAEGEYILTRSSGKPEIVGKRLDHWALWKLKDETLQVQTQLDAPRGHATQGFVFTRLLKPIGYRLRLFAKANKREGDEGARLSLNCELLPHLIKCAVEFNGKRTSLELPAANSDYAFLPGEFYGIDLSWLFASLIQNRREDAEIPVYSLGENHAGEPRIELDQQLSKIHLIGADTVSVMGKTIRANEYELLGKWLVWTAPSTGIVLVVEPADHTGRWELKNFKTYSPDFMPELH
jgi:hypothetical protein